MSFLPSLLLYNPLEALILILFCDVFTKRKFKKIDILHCLGLGVINFVFQYASMLMTDSRLVLIYDLLMVVVTGFILLVYYKTLISKEIKLSHSVYAMIFSFTTIPIVCNLANIIIEDIYKLGFSNKYDELLINLTLRVLQFIVILIIKLGVSKFEKGKGYVEENGRGFN